MFGRVREKERGIPHGEERRFFCIFGFRTERNRGKRGGEGFGLGTFRLLTKNSKFQGHISKKLTKEKQEATDDYNLPRMNSISKNANLPSKPIEMRRIC